MENGKTEKDNGKTPLREKFNEIINDLEENKYTNLGSTK